MEVILPAFMKRFPGVTIDHIDATADELLARIVSEVRGGRLFGDVFGGALPYMAQASDQKLLAPLTVPEAAAYPAQMKSDFWIATDTQFYIAGWNTNLIKKGEEPKSFEDLANPKWKDGLMGEPRDFQMLIGLAKRKYNNDEKAIDLMKRIAANQVEFHKGHSQLVEFLVAGQRPVCFTCYAHHFPPRMKKGAPIQPLLTEGVGEVGGAVSILRADRTPMRLCSGRAGPSAKKANTSMLRPAKLPLTQYRTVRKSPTHGSLHAHHRRHQGVSEYEKLWKEIFQIR